MSAIPLMTPSMPPPLSAEQLQQIVQARHGYAPIRRARSIALFDAWSVAIFAGLTILMSMSSPDGLLLGMAMAVIAIVEFRQGPRLARLDPEAPRRLGINQLALGGALILYAAWHLLRGPGAGFLGAIGSSDPQMAQLLHDPQVASMLGPYENIARQIHMAIYLGVMLIGLIAQGGMALYYFRRAGHIRSYISTTPTWIQELQRAGMTV